MGEGCLVDYAVIRPCGRLTARLVCFVNCSASY